MRRSWSQRSVPLTLAAGCYLLALVQRPGLATSDTKIDLHVDPGGFLGRVAEVWSPTAGLGHVQGGQYGGYLWPMGPFFAALHSLGLSPWLIHRLWLGTLLALAAWGMVRLLDALLSPRRGVAHVVAAVALVACPYVIVFGSRTSYFLIGCSALPWLLLATHRGLRSDRPWWWAALGALILTSTGGGVNAAVTAWLLVGPALLLVYETFLRDVPRRAAAGFAGRAALASAVASIWWVVPALVQARYGLNFLSFTEQVGSIWHTTSLPESLRLMGYWPSYLGVGYGDVLRPYFESSRTLLFDLPVVVATLLVPGLALAGFAWTRRWRYGPFFLALGLLGALVMSVGFPDGTPFRRGAIFVYNHTDALDFLRTTYKAGPLVAVAVACLAGAAAAELWRRLPSAPVRAAAALAAAAIVVLAALPLFRGDAVELTWKRIPAAWKKAARDLDRDLPRGTRALVLPGQPFAFYRWGGTVDPILPSLTDRPVAIRNVPPYDDLHAVDLLWTTDNLVQQERLLPGQLAPLLGLMSVGAVVTGTDDDTGRSGAPPPAAAAAQLARQPGFDRPSRSYGPRRRFGGPAGPVLPQVRRYDLGSPVGRPMVRREPLFAELVVDGSAAGVANLAAFGRVPDRGPLLYAGDLSAAAIRAQAAAGAEVAITDSNRRRSFLASRPRASYAWTLPASVAVSDEGAVLNPFPDRGTPAQTVAAYGGARYVEAPYSPQVAQFSEHRPYAAFDSDPATSWLPDPTLEDAKHWVEVGLSAPREVPYVDLLPDDSNPSVAVTRVSIDGREFDVHPGWNRLPVRLREAHALRVTITGHRTTSDKAGGGGGIREVRAPGLRVTERMRGPVLAERALRGTNLDRTTLTYAFERTTADRPLRRDPEPGPPPASGNRVEAEAALERASVDPETGIDRVLTPPAARRWRVRGLGTVAPDAADDWLDALAGTSTDGARIRSSGRFEGTPANRGSSAFDGDPRRVWLAPWRASRSAWLEWRVRRPVELRRLVLEPPPRYARMPTRVSVSWDGGRSGPLPVGADGAVVLPRTVRARRFRVEVLATTPGFARAVGIGELRAPGLPRAEHAHGVSPLHARCGLVTAFAGGRRIRLVPVASAAELDAGHAVGLEACDHAVSLPARRMLLHTAPSPIRPLLLELRSPAPLPVAAASAVAADRLVLGTSYNRGWRAECDGRSLGRPSVVDGFANGWRAGPRCGRARFHFAPQDAVDAGYWVGGAACALLALLLLLRRPRRAPPEAPPDELPVDDRRLPWPLRSALAAGLAAGVVLGFVFAIRAGVAIGPFVALVLWRGVPARTLIAAAGALLAVVVPLLYVLFPGDDRGGYDTDYAVEHLGAHWVTVAALVLLLLALARTLSTASRRSGGRAGGRAAARAGPTRP